MKTRSFLTVLFSLFVSASVFALRVESGNDVYITQPVFEDIYVFGGTLTINAPVHGDLWCAGGTIAVNDSVLGDLVVAGGNLNLRGVVADDVRAAGGNLIISGNIAGDLLVTGGTVTVDPTAAIAGDLAFSGGTVTIGSAVSGAVKAMGSKVFLNGSIGKTLEFNGGELVVNGTVTGASEIIASSIQLGDRAAFQGNVRYWTDKGEMDMSKALSNGVTATFDPALRDRMERPDARFLGFASFLAVLWYLMASFILLWLGQWLFANTFQQAATTAQTEPMRSLGYGFLYFAATPIAIVLLFVTVIGIPVGLIGLLFYGLFFALSNVMTALVAAHWIKMRKNYHWRPIQLVFVSLGLLIVLKLLSATPFLGWIILFAAVFIAFGAIVQNTGLFHRKPIEPSN